MWPKAPRIGERQVGATCRIIWPTPVRVGDKLRPRGSGVGDRWETRERHAESCSLWGRCGKQVGDHRGRMRPRAPGIVPLASHALVSHFLSLLQRNCDANFWKNSSLSLSLPPSSVLWFATDGLHLLNACLISLPFLPRVLPWLPAWPLNLSFFAPAVSWRQQVGASFFCLGMFGANAGIKNVIQCVQVTVGLLHQGCLVLRLRAKCLGVLQPRVVQMVLDWLRRCKGMSREEFGKVIGRQDSDLPRARRVNGKD